MLRVFIISSSKRENSEVSLPEHLGVVTYAHCAGEPGGRCKMASATKCDISLVIALGRLANAMQLLIASLVPETYEESCTVYVPLKEI